MLRMTSRKAIRVLVNRCWLFLCGAVALLCTQCLDRGDCCSGSNGCDRCDIGMKKKCERLRSFDGYGKHSGFSGI